MTTFELIDKYSEMSNGRFKTLMTQLPQKLQEHFVVVVPSAHLSSIAISDNADVIRVERKITLPVVELHSSKGELPIPPAYAEIISEMEKILQKIYADKVYESAWNNCKEQY